jgi:signal transduction histidine kinase
MERFRQRAWLSWASVILLALLCGFLAFLQYRWTGEITDAERNRLHEALQVRLNGLSRTFNQDISAAINSLVPALQDVQATGRAPAFSAQYIHWKNTHERIFDRVALAVPEEDGLMLFNLNLETGELAAGEWPAGWNGLRDRLSRRISGAPPGSMEMAPDQSPTTLEFPRFRPPSPDHRAVREQDWLLLEINMSYIRDTLLPDLLNRFLGEGGRLDYDAVVFDSFHPSEVVCDLSPGHPRGIERKPDGSVALLQVRPTGFGPFGGFGGGRRLLGPGPVLGRSGPPPEGMQIQGRWRLLVRHRAGSLEALVARTRWRNLGVSGAILLLILATVAALVRFSRQAQRLAELQMNFVAGVSHELRTPLTVIRTAAYNLRGRIANRPEQVERYGTLIQGEAEKLAALMEQVLSFASMRAGHAIRACEPVSVEKMIEEGLQSSRAALAGPNLVLEKHVGPDLPLVLADKTAMRHAFENLVENALKYGVEGSNWIGVFVSAINDKEGSAVEIRVADRGPGIPLDEQEHIFDPFFRGRRAIQDQVRGTGLGLNLVKQIVEAHGGSIRVRSGPMEGTEFIVRIPAAPPEMQSEFTHSVG